MSIDEKALDEAILTMRPTVWKDMETLVLAGDIPAAQLPMRVEMWCKDIRPHLAKAIETYEAAKSEQPVLGNWRTGCTYCGHDFDGHHEGCKWFKLPEQPVIGHVENDKA